MNAHRCNDLSRVPQDELVDLHRTTLLLTPVEKMIYDAAQAVEAMPADVRLTRAGMFLAQAREAVADFVDGHHRMPPVGGCCSACGRNPTPKERQHVGAPGACTTCGSPYECDECGRLLFEDPTSHKLKAYKPEGT